MNGVELNNRLEVEVNDFTDELTDEALDRSMGEGAVAPQCCSVGCANA